MTSECVELPVVPLHLLTPHLLSLPIRLKSIMPPFVGVPGIVIVKPKAITEGIAETEG